MLGITKNKIKEIFSLTYCLYTLAGVLVSAIAINGFLIPNNFMDGGVTSIAIILKELTHANYGLIFILVNLVFIYFSYQKIGPVFTIRSVVAIVILGILSNYIVMPNFTEDKVLIAFFGGFLIGLGIGLVLRGGAIIDGLEVIADYTNKLSGFSASEMLLMINVFIMLCAGYYFGFETAMYSILTYFTANRTSNYIVDGVEESTSITIISKESELIKNTLVKQYNKAVSVFKGERGYLPGKEMQIFDCDIIVVIVTRLEIFTIKKAVFDMDPVAFLYVQSVKEVEGGVVINKLSKEKMQ